MDAEHFSIVGQIMDTNECLCYAKDREGKYLYANKAYCNAFNVKQPDLLGRDDHFVFPSNIALILQDNDKRIMESRHPEVVDETGVINGKTQTYRSNKSPMFDERGGVCGISGLAINITYEKQLEKEKSDLVNKLERTNKTKDKLFSVIAHDLRSPFNQLLGITQFLSQQSDLSEADKKLMLQDLHAASSSTFLMLENLLSWSLAQIKDQKAIKKMVLAKPFISGCIESHLISSKNKNIEIINQIPENIRWNIDESSISIVVSNLLSNAIKFSHQHGTITLTGNATADHGTLTVQDTGVGMSPSQLSRIFDNTDYITTRGTYSEAGTGLGLGLCYDLVRKNGGEISVISSEEHGSSFTLSFPTKN